MVAANLPPPQRRQSHRMHLTSSFWRRSPSCCLVWSDSGVATRLHSSVAPLAGRLLSQPRSCSKPCGRNEKMKYFYLTFGEKIILSGPYGIPGDICVIGNGIWIKIKESLCTGRPIWEMNMRVNGNMIATKVINADSPFIFLMVTKWIQLLKVLRTKNFKIVNLNIKLLRF